MNVFIKGCVFPKECDHWESEGHRGVAGKDGEPKVRGITMLAVAQSNIRWNPARLRTPFPEAL